MSLEEVIVRIVEYFDRQKAGNLERWRMVRRLCFIQAKTMGAKMNNETELWDIEGDRPTGVTKERIEEWREWLIRHGKMKGEA